MADIIQIRRDIAANWTAANPVLAQGEFGVETDTLKLKIGDGASPWTGLRYYHSGSPYEAGEGISINDFTINNTGIITIGTGGTNGTIKANGQDIAVKGLGSAAYVDTTTLPNKDLSNLTTKGANIGNWSSNVSNCIIEIPQDIKLEINGSNGITLKSGSKLYQPNGSGTFTPIAISGDKSRNDFSVWGSGEYMMFRSTSQYTPNGGIICVTSNNCVSGATDTSTASTHIWYDTTNNIVKLYESGTYARTDLSFPIAIITVVNGTGVTSIDQVFNGFGYIGSTVFALPGVKGLIPNGRNSDGTLKNIIINNSSVRTNTTSAITDGDCDWYFRNSNTQDIVSPNARAYDSNRNIIYSISSGDVFTDRFLACKIKLESKKVVLLASKPVFHAVDYSDTEFIANCSMPSARYISLSTDISSGYSFTAPADGYLSIIKSGSTGEWVYMRNATSGLNIGIQYSANLNGRLYIPVAKGQSVTISWNGTGAVSDFRFIYANGSK